MHIVVVSQNFYPEEFKVNDLVKELVIRGHCVTVLTGKPNYPKGEYFENYKFSGIQKETIFGAKIIRVPVIKRGSGGSIRLILNYLSFVFFGCWYSLTHKIKTDAVLCFAPSPITQVFPAIIIKNRNKCKLSLWYQDIWPEGVYAVTGINNKYIKILLNIMVNNIYCKVDNIMVQSKEFAKSINRSRDFSSKIIYVPNWAENLYFEVKGIKEKYKHFFKNNYFNIMFAGNIGEAQDINSIIKAIQIKKHHHHIKYYFIGDGRARKRAENEVKANGLEDLVHFLGRFPMSEMPNLLVHADVMMVSLSDNESCSLTIPSRIQAYMASGKPIVAMLSGAGSKEVDNAKCGLTCSSGDYTKFAENIYTLSLLNKEQLQIMGDNGKEYYKQNFQKTRVIDKIENNLK